MKRTLAMIVFCLFGGAGIVAQNTTSQGLAASLVRSATSSLGSSISDIRRAGLSLLAILVDTRGQDAAQIDAAFEDSSVRPALARLVGATTPDQPFAAEIMRKVDVRLGYDAAESAQLLNASAPNEEDYRLTSKAGVNQEYRLVRLSPVSTREYQMQTSCASTSSVTFFGLPDFSVIQRTNLRRTPSPVLPEMPPAAILGRIQVPSTCSSDFQITLASRPYPEALQLATSGGEAKLVAADREYRGTAGQDRNWVRFDAEARGFYRIETLRLRNSDTEIFLYADGGRDILDSDDDSGAESNASRIDWLCPQGGRYWIKIRDLDGGKGSFDFVIRTTGHYKVTALQTVGSDRSKAVAISPSEEVLRIIAPERVQSERVQSTWLRLDGEAGNVYQVRASAEITITSPQGGPPVTPSSRNDNTEIGPFSRSALLFAAGSGSYFIRLSRESNRPLFAQVRVAGRKRAPTKAIWKSSRSGAPELSLPDKPLVLVELPRKSVRYASFQVTPGNQVSLGLQSLTNDVGLVAEIVRGDDGLRKVVASDTMSLMTWDPQSPGPYLVRVTNDSSEAAVGFLEIQQSNAYDGLKKGDRVVLGRHLAVDGSENWSDDMMPFLGRETVIQDLRGVDSSGSYVVRVEADGQKHFWRTRDMKRPSPKP